MSGFTEQHEKGVRAFTESLEHKQVTSSSCEFEDSVLHSEWRAHVETTPKSGHINADSRPRTVTRTELSTSICDRPSWPQFRPGAPVADGASRSCRHRLQTADTQSVSGSTMPNPKTEKNPIKIPIHTKSKRTVCSQSGGCQTIFGPIELPIAPMMRRTTPNTNPRSAFFA